MKILYITDQIYLHGGVERVLTNKSNYFIENDKAKVYIVTTEQKDNLPCYPINSDVVFYDLDINYHRSVSYFRLANLIKVPKHFFRLKKIIKKIKPDVVITLSNQFDYYFLPFIHKKIPKIKEFHSSRYYSNLERIQNKSFFRKIFYALNDYIESRYDYLVLLTKDEQQYFKSKNTVVIPNALSNYSNETSDLKNEIAISAGRIAPVKQFDKLIKTWSYVAATHPNWKLEIYGEGDDRDIKELQSLINKYNIKDKVKLCGSTDKLEIKMLNSSLYVMSSQTECFPMVLLEAMNCGLPIISFDCPHGPKNIITHNIDGVLTERDSEKELADAIISILEDPNDLKNKGKMAKENVKRFQPDYVMEYWINLIDLSINS